MPISTAVATLKFIPPSEPVEHERPPTGKGWCHEVKFDGYRLQLHKLAETGNPASERSQRLSALIYSKNGKDFTARFRDLARAVAELPCKSCIIDAEGCAVDEQGRPDFRALVGGQKHSRVAFCFDLLEVDGREVTAFPLLTRRVRLRALLNPEPDLLRYSESFKDPEALLGACCEKGLEGIVSKRTDQPYVSGKNRGWMKVKCTPGGRKIVIEVGCSTERGRKCDE
jgi:bifunctional non-homologous end joining protein LigD